MQKKNGQALEGKRILITGGTTGIGRAAALSLAASGARVFTFGRHEKELKDALKDSTAAGNPISGITADAARIEDVRKVFAGAEKALGGIDVLINNAALSAEGILDMEWSDAEYVVRSNLLGYMACAQEAARRMKDKGRGHIINVGSMSADVREKGSSVYVATKSAIQGFTEALRKEVNEFGIKVSLIEPGAVGTDMQPVSVPDQRKKIASGEMLQAEDIARCIEFTLTQPDRCDVVVIQVRPHKQEI
jgi:NAD(P)-dependent dehydrogenase (short-subunit alcohol dehydrogenase family)